MTFSSDNPKVLPSSHPKMHQNDSNDDFLYFIGLMIILFPAILITVIAFNAQTNSSASLKSPQVYKLFEVRNGALANTNETEKTKLYGEKFETAVRIVYESIKIHTYPDEREWIDMCKRIILELDKALKPNWNCIVSDKPIKSVVRTNNDYMMIELDDLYFEIFRSR